MPNVTQTTADVFIDEYWADELNRAVEYKIVITENFSDFTSKMRNSGDLFHRPARHHLTANTKSPGTDATPEALTETQQNFTVSTHQIVAQEIEDIAEIMSKYDIRAEFNREFSYALGRAMDVAAAALLDDNTAQSVGVLGSELTDANLVRAWQYLMDGAATPPFKGVVSPATWAGLLLIEKFTNQLYNGDTGGKALHEAQIGKIYQATMFVSQLTVGTAPNSSGHMWAADHFFKIIKRKPTPHAQYDPFAVAWKLSADQIFGVFENQEADEGAAVTTVSRLWGVRLQSIK